MRGATVEKDHLLALELDRNRGDLSHGPLETNAFRSQLIELTCAWKDAEVKLGGFASVVIEPEEWRKFVHGWHRSNRRSLPTSRLLVSNRAREYARERPKSGSDGRMTATTSSCIFSMR